MRSGSRPVTMPRPFERERRRRPSAYAARVRRLFDVSEREAREIGREVIEASTRPDSSPRMDREGRSRFRPRAERARGGCRGASSDSDQAVVRPLGGLCSREGRDAGSVQRRGPDRISPGGRDTNAPNSVSAAALPNGPLLEGVSGTPESPQPAALRQSRDWDDADTGERSETRISARTARGPQQHDDWRHFGPQSQCRECSAASKRDESDRADAWLTPAQQGANRSATARATLRVGPIGRGFGCPNFKGMTSNSSHRRQRGEHGNGRIRTANHPRLSRALSRDCASVEPFQARSAACFALSPPVRVGLSSIVSDRATALALGPPARANPPPIGTPRRHRACRASGRFSPSR